MNALLEFDNVENKKCIYNSLNSDLDGTLQTKACQFYDDLFNIMHNVEEIINDDEFVHLVLPIAKYVISNYDITNIQDSALKLSNYLSQFLIYKNGSRHYVVPCEIIKNYPGNKHMKDIDVMIVLACDFINYFQDRKGY